MVQIAKRIKGIMKKNSQKFQRKSVNLQRKKGRTQRK